MELLRRLRLTRAREVIKLGCTLATNKDAGGPDATGLGEELVLGRWQVG